MTTTRELAWGITDEIRFTIPPDVPRTYVADLIEEALNRGLLTSVDKIEEETEKIRDEAYEIGEQDGRDRGWEECAQKKEDLFNRIAAAVGSKLNDLVSLIDADASKGNDRLTAEEIANDIVAMLERQSVEP